MSGARKRVFILGFDGATFDLIRPNLNELPNFRRLMEEGCSGPLLSTVPPVSAPAWASFATGNNPGKHSIYGFTRRMEGSYNLTPVNGSHLRCQTLWGYLSRSGRQVISINVPMTFPPEPVNGVLVSGCDAPGPDLDFTHPAEFKKRLFELVPDYRIRLTLGGYLTSEAKRLKALDILGEDIDGKLRLALHLMAEQPWDLFVIKFNDPDVVQHHFWRFMDPGHPAHPRGADPRLQGAVRSIYRRLDGVIGEVRRRLTPEDTLLVMSDHGAGPRINKAIYLNEWLLSQGLLARSRGGAGRWLDDHVYNSLERTVVLLLRLFPPAFKDWLQKRFSSQVAGAVSYFKLAGIDWARTAAYVGEIESLRINRRGLYPQGTVDEAACEELSARLIEGLLGLVDPKTGERVIGQVARKADVYHGAHVDNMPEILIMTADYKYDVSWKFFRGGRRNRNGFVVGQEHWRGTSGSHRPEGIFICAGKDIRRGRQIEGASIMDIFPTVVHDLGLPVPSDLDGRVITEAFSQDYLTAHPVAYQDAGYSGSGQGGEVYTPEEAEAIKKFLKELGYME